MKGLLIPKVDCGEQNELEWDYNLAFIFNISLKDKKENENRSSKM